MAGRRDLNRTFSPATNSFQRLSFTVVWEKSFLESECLRIWNFYPFHYADKVIGTIPFENLYLYLENIIVLLFYRAKLQYYGILSLNSFCTLSSTISLCTYHTFFHSLSFVAEKDYQNDSFLVSSNSISSIQRSYHFIIQLLSFLQNCIICRILSLNLQFFFAYIYIFIFSSIPYH